MRSKISPSGISDRETCYRRSVQAGEMHLCGKALLPLAELSAGRREGGPAAKHPGADLCSKAGRRRRLTEGFSVVVIVFIEELGFRLEPVVQCGTRLITSQDVEFMGPSPDSFFG